MSRLSSFLRTSTLALALTASVASIATPAYARGWHGRGWGWGWGVGLGVAVAADAALLGWPGYYYNPYYPYPYAPAANVTVVQSPPVVAAPAQPPAAVWYYCGNPGGYYPYVQTCQVPWQTVPAMPAPTSAPAR